MKESTSDRNRIRRLREKYKRRVVIVGIVLFLVGLLLGLFLGSRLPGNGGDTTVVAPAVTPVLPSGSAEDISEGEGSLAGSDAAGLTGDASGFDGELSGETEGFPGEGEDNTLVLEATPTPTPTPEPTPEPTPAVVAVVPFGESYTYTTQIKADGSVRREADEDVFETISFTQTMKGYMLPQDFAAAYGTMYKLKGNEAGAEFELTLNNYTGSTAIFPQNTMEFAFEDASGETHELGYQLMDAYVSGNYNVSVSTNTPKLLYKRYAYTNNGNPMKYLVVTTYENGVEKHVKFELEGAAPIATDTPKTYESLKKGDKSDAVADVQAKLIELGFLEGTADGDFGSKTETAIKLAQGQFGMEETGVADNDFQQKLYAAQSQAEAGEAQGTEATDDTGVADEAANFDEGA